MVMDFEITGLPQVSFPIGWASQLRSEDSTSFASLITFNIEDAIVFSYFFRKVFMMREIHKTRKMWGIVISKKLSLYFASDHNIIFTLHPAGDAEGSR